MDNKTYKTSNPALNEKVFEAQADNTSMNTVGGGTTLTSGDPMTLGGTVAKTYLLLGITIAACAVTWHFAFASTSAAAGMFPLVIGGFVLGMIIAFVIIFNPRLAPILAPFYAAFEGLALGGVSAYYEASYPGIVMQSVGLTLCVFIAMLLSFNSGLIKATEKFKMGVCAATMGVFIFYLLSMVMSFGFGMHVPMIHDSGLFGIGFSLFVVVLAALNLVLDFDFIQTGVAKRAPKNMEWYAAFGLMVTLIWLYIEVLRLISKLRSR